MKPNAVRKKLDIINSWLRWIMIRLRIRNFYSQIKGIKIENPSILKPLNVEQEKAYVKKWSRLNKHVKLDYFRICSNISGRIDLNYAPLEINNAIIERILNNSSYTDYEQEKNNYELFFDKNLLPMTRIRRINGEYFDGEFNFINYDEAQRIFDLIAKDIIIKPAKDTHSGNNVFKFEYRADSFYEGDKITSFEDVDSRIKSDYLIQEKIEQHSFFEQFNGDSLNTIRINTYRSVKDNQIHVVSPFIRFGRKGSAVDNICAGGFACRLDKLGNFPDFAVDSYGRKYLGHPDSGLIFKGMQVPFYDEIKQIVLIAAKKIIHQRLIGFDIAVTKESQIKIIEMNLLSIGFNMSQSMPGGFYGEYTDEVIDHCAANLKKDKHRIINI